jgi:hypothetical protein
MPAAGEPQAAVARIEIAEPAQIEPPVQAVEAGIDGAQDEELAVDEKQKIASLAQKVEKLATSVERAVQQARVDAQVGSASDRSGVQSGLQVSLRQTVPATSQDSGSNSLPDYRRWLDEKLVQSRQWLSQAKRNKMSIQVMMRNKSAARELVYYLRNDWPLDLTQTYLYEVSIEGRSIYRVFYSEFDSLKQARAQIDMLPQSIKVNSPYVHSVYRMRKALL